MSDLSELIKPLYEATMEKKISWKIDSEALISSLQGDSLVEIMSSKNVVRLTIRNKDGLALDYEIYSQEEEDGDLLYSIFTKIKRDALGVDEAIESVKRSLLKALR